MGFEAYKRRLAYSVTVRILAQNSFILLLSLMYWSIKGKRIKFVYVAMCFLVMSLCSHDIINSALTYTAPGF